MLMLMLIDSEGSYMLTLFYTSKGKTWPLIGCEQMGREGGGSFFKRSYQDLGFEP